MRWSVVLVVVMMVGSVVLLGLILLSDSNTPRQENAAQELVTYRSSLGTFSLDLPAHWVGYSVYDGTEYEIGLLEEGHGSYGPSGSRQNVHLTAEAIRRELVDDRSKDDLYALMLDIRFSQDEYPLSSKQIEGDVTVYVHDKKVGLPDDIEHGSHDQQRYIVYARDNVALLLALYEVNELTERIASSATLF